MVARFHYDDLVFRRLLEDELPGSETAQVTEHIEACAACQSKLESISEEGIQWRKVRVHLLPEKGSDPESGGSTIEGDAARTMQGQPAVGFLSPSERPGSVGRFGRYEIEEILGCGGMGIVLRGFDPALNRHSAIKVLAPELATSAAARNRFAREAKSAAAVVHEHVVPIQTVDQQRGLPYLVMPVVDGKSLEQRVAQHGPLQLKEVLRIGMQTAMGLAAAHAQGLVHRDIKPANILLENGVERVRITDFGLARTVDDANMTQSGVIAGTPQYMSPEQARGCDIDCRSDLFSLGSVLYFMCTGHSPFRAETTMGVLHRITNDTPRELRQVNPEFPLWLQQIIDRLLAKDPDQRFPSAGEVADLLGRWLAHLQQPDTVCPPESDIPAKAPAADRERQVPVWKIGLTATAACALALAGVLMVIELSKGTLTIESDADDVPIRITQGSRIVRQLTVSRDGKMVRVAAGKYTVEIAGQSDAIMIENGVVELRWRGKRLVKIVARGTDVERPDRTSTDLAATDRSTRDPIAPEFEKLLGRWVLEGSESETERDTVTIQSGDRSLEFRFTDVGGRRQTGAFSLVSGAWLKKSLFTVTVTDESGVRREWVGEYELSGDQLSLKFTGINLSGVPRGSDLHHHLDWSVISLDKNAPRHIIGTYHRQTLRAETPAARRSDAESYDPTNTTQVMFPGPAGMRVVRPSAREAAPLVSPGRWNLLQGETHALRMTRIRSRPGLRIDMTLELPNVTGRTKAFLAHNAVPVRIAQEDLDAISTGNHLVKVLYLPRASGHEAGVTAGIQSAVSTRLDPGVDPIALAKQRGAIVAILRSAR